MKKKEYKLKACPYCGGKPFMDTSALGTFVTCATSYLRCPMSPKTEWYKTRRRAAGVWNMRPRKKK